MNWAKLIEDLMEIYSLNQSEFAEKCNTTQQSISNITRSVRAPGIKTREKIRSLAVEVGIHLDNYKVKAVKSPQEISLALGIPKAVYAHALWLSELPARRRNKIIRISRFVEDLE